VYFKLRAVLHHKLDRAMNAAAERNVGWYHYGDLKEIAAGRRLYRADSKTRRQG